MAQKPMKYGHFKLVDVSVSDTCPTLTLLGHASHTPLDVAIFILFFCLVGHVGDISDMCVLRTGVSVAMSMSACVCKIKSVAITEG